LDNLTHTLIGLVAGEAMARGTRAHPDGLCDPTRRTALLAMGMIGGNLPDADLLWSLPAFTGDALGYIVHHRGHTHTLLGCAVLAVLLFLGTVAVLRWRGHRLRAPDARLLGGMALLAVMLHLGMDALNAYGVHPFWPWNNRWYYGDAMFIVEPLYWLAVAPLFFSLRTRAARWLTGCALVIGSIAVLAFHRFAVVAWALPVLSLLMLGIGRARSPRAAARLGVCVVIAVSAIFWATHALVSKRVQAVAARQFPDASTLDIVLSPAPAAPFCWEVLLLQRAGTEYVARIGQHSLVSASGQSCARSLISAGAAPLQPMELPVVSGVRWRQQFTMDAAALARLAASTCDTRRLASFLRAPFAVETSEGWILGDLRYDRESGTSFAALLVDPRVPARCEQATPWTAPRQDLGL
jgi:inner membrane protein